MTTSKKIKIRILTPKEGPPTNKEIASLKKEDFVLIVKRRKLAYTTASLWSMKITDLKEILTSIDREDIEYVELKRNRRKIYKEFSLEEIRQLLLEHDLPIHGRSRGGMIDTLLEDIKKTTFGFKPDEDQQAAIDRCYSDELVINAGPGSGKTSTLCYMASKMHHENKEERIIILVYNKKAEAILKSRLKYLKCDIIPKTKAFDSTAKGICVLTFDKFGHAAVKTAGQYVFGKEDKSYRLSLESSIPIIATLGSEWNEIILDEAQDILQIHSNIIQTIKDTNKTKIRKCTAGDPKQELYSGAVYFSNLWNTSSEECKQVLRYNHRSARKIVSLLNAYSRAIFPSLHHDQIPVREDEGNFATYLNNDPTTRGEIIGKLISDCEPGDAYALVPVTLDKFNLSVVTNTARQVISELRPGVLVNIFNDYTPYSYDMATVKKMKGTEKPTTVVYGVELDYSLVIDEIMTRKLLFVAISRARDNLYLVSELSSNPHVKARLAPLMKMAGITRELESKINYKLPSFSVTVTTSQLGCETGLSSCSGIDVSLLKGDITSSLRLNTDLGADFIGHYSEALVLKALGVELFTPDNIVVLASTEHLFLGPYKRKDIYVLEVVSSRVKIMKNIISDCITKLGYIEGKDDAFFHATLRYSFEIGKLWTVSKELLDTSLVAQYNADKIASYIKKISKGKLSALGQLSHPIYFRRGGTDKPSLGSINYVPDTMVGFPIELKHTLKLTDQYRRQAAIYACLTKSEYAVLINTNDGKVEFIKPADYLTVINTAKAILAMRLSRRQLLGPLAGVGISPPRDLTHGCIISVDIETSGIKGHLVTEIGAVAFSAVDFSIIGVYDKRPPTVREMTADEITLSEMYYAANTDFNRIEKLTGLIVLDESVLLEQTKELCADFYKWVESISTVRSIFHWGGCEDRLFGHLGNTYDIRNCTFMPWLDNMGFPRTNLSSLEVACQQIVPHYKFYPHRAYEDSIGTMLVFIAATSFSSLA